MSTRWGRTHNFSDKNKEASPTVRVVVPMFYTERIEKIVENILFSSYVKGRRSLSLILIAPPSSGKTDILRQYENGTSIRVFNAFTQAGLAKSGVLEQISKKQIKTILVPEIATAFQYRITRDAQILFYNQLTEEGIKNLISNVMYISLPTPARCSIIGAMTHRRFVQNKELANDLGFTSRMFCIYYDYSKYVRHMILRNIKGNDHDGVLRKKKMNFPKFSVEIDCPEAITKELRIVAKRLASLSFSVSISPRILNRLITFLKANALRNNRREVTKEDLKEFYQLLHMFYRSDGPPFIVSVYGRCHRCGRRMRKRVVSGRCIICKKFRSPECWKPRMCGHCRV